MERCAARGVRVAIEAGNRTAWIVDLLRELGATVHVVHPLTGKRIAESKKKTDRIDAQLLPHLLRVGGLPEPVPSHRSRERRGWLVARRQLVQMRTKLLNVVRGLARQPRIELPPRALRTPRGWGQLAAADLTPALREVVAAYEAIVQAVGTALGALDGQLAQRARRDPRGARLETMPGVGPVCAQTRVAAVDTSDRFATAKKLVAYARLAPSVRASGERVEYGRITRGGRSRYWCVRCPVNARDACGTAEDYLIVQLGSHSVSVLAIDEEGGGHRGGMRLTDAARWIAKAGRALAARGARRGAADDEAGMTAEERFLFDLEGYLVIRQVLGAAEVAALNAIADTKAPALSAARAYDRVFRASAWGPPYRALIDHPRIVPYLVALVGTRFRLDHDYCIFTATGGRGPDLHGGASEENPDHWYAYRDGVIRSGLTVVTYCLTGASPGDGGFCCIPGSHKSNFVASLPADVRAHRRRPHYVVQPALEAGDVVIFTEALLHGAAPWTARHERRALLYKYSPGHSAWMGEYYQVGDYPGLTERQRRILAPPSVGDRPPSVPGR